MGAEVPRIPPPAGVREDIWPTVPTTTLNQTSQSADPYSPNTVAFEEFGFCPKRLKQGLTQLAMHLLMGRAALPPKQRLAAYCCFMGCVVFMVCHGLVSQC
jgi:hypothetical protein